jgi:hypothetical protein
MESWHVPPSTVQVFFSLLLILIWRCVGQHRLLTLGQHRLLTLMSPFRHEGEKSLDQTSVATDLQQRHANFESALLSKNKFLKCLAKFDLPTQTALKQI